MARVTVEDCVKNIPNRFGLVLVAANRAKKISKGAASELPAETIKSSTPDKPPVLALREIADNEELSNKLESELISSFQKVHFATEEPEEDTTELEPDQDWSEQIAQLSRELESLGSVDEDEDSDFQQELTKDMPSEDDEADEE